MTEVGLMAGCAHKSPLPFKPRNQHKSIKMKGAGCTTAVGRSSPPEKRGNKWGGCTEME